MSIDPVAEYLRTNEVVIEWAGCTFKAWYEGPYDHFVFIWSPASRVGLDAGKREGVAMARLMCSGTGTGDSLAVWLELGGAFVYRSTIMGCFSLTDRDEIEALARTKAAEELRK